MVSYSNWSRLTTCVLLIISNAAFACGEITESMTSKAIAARIAPLGAVNVVDASGQAVVAAPVAEELGPKSAEKRYKASCAVCHDQGLAGAPKFRDKADWGSRLGQGLDALVASAIKGKGGMPARGTCMQCSDQEIHITVEYMLPQS